MMLHISKGFSVICFLYQVFVINANTGIFCPPSLCHPFYSSVQATPDPSSLNSTNDLTLGSYFSPPEVVPCSRGQRVGLSFYINDTSDIVVDSCPRVDEFQRIYLNISNLVSRPPSTNGISLSLSWGVNLFSSVRVPIGGYPGTNCTATRKDNDGKEYPVPGTLYATVHLAKFVMRDGKSDISEDGGGFVFEKTCRGGRCMLGSAPCLAGSYCAECIPNNERFGVSVYIAYYGTDKHGAVRSHSRWDSRQQMRSSSTNPVNFWKYSATALGDALLGQAKDIQKNLPTF